MHNWALFSFSGLMTVAAYNVAQSPQIAKIIPDVEPQPTGDAVPDENFNLSGLSAEAMNYEPTVSLPPLPDMPQLSTSEKAVSAGAIKEPDLSELSGEGGDFDLGALLGEADTFDIEAMLREDEALLATLEDIPTYRVEAVQPLSSIPVPDQPIPSQASDRAAKEFSAIPAPTAPAPTVVSGIAEVSPVAATSTPAAAENFSEGNPTAEVTAPTPLPEIAASTPRPTVPDASPQFTPNPPQAAIPRAQEDAEVVDDADSPAIVAATPRALEAARNLFAPLPVVEVSANTMTAKLPDDVAPLAAEAEPAPTSHVSMRAQLIRYRLSTRLCEQAQVAANAESSAEVCAVDANVLAQRMPEAATAGTPMPGSVLSPTLNSPATGVLQLGKNPVPAEIAGP